MGWSHIRSFHHDFVFLFFFSSGSRSERLLRVYNWSPPFRALLKHLFFNYQFNCDLLASYKKWPRVRACPPCLIPKVWLYSGKKSISGRYRHIILCIAAYSDDKNQAVEDSVTVAMHSLSLSVSSLFLLLTFPLWPKIFFYYPQFFVFFFPPPLAFLLCILPLIRPLWSDRMKVGTLYMGSLQAQPPSLTAPITLARPRHPRLWKVSRHWDSLWVTETDSSCVCGYRQQYRSWWR